MSGIIKTCRKTMRKDKGLNGDADRLPMLTWIMFLKFLDDLERIRETDMKLAGKRFRPAIESPYRWRDWAAKPDGITGDELIKFVNNDEAIGKLIAEAFGKVGKEGVITVEEAKGTDTTVDVVEGMQFDRGYISPYFVTNSEKNGG